MGLVSRWDQAGPHPPSPPWLLSHLLLLLRDVSSVLPARHSSPWHCTASRRSLRCAGLECVSEPTEQPQHRPGGTGHARSVGPAASCSRKKKALRSLNMSAPRKTKVSE